MGPTLSPPANTCSRAAENLPRRRFSGSVHVLGWCSLVNLFNLLYAWQACRQRQEYENMISLHASQQEHTCAHARVTQMQTRKKGNALKAPISTLSNQRWKETILFSILCLRPHFTVFSPQEPETLGTQNSPDFLNAQLFKTGSGWRVLLKQKSLLSLVDVL